MNKKWIKNLTIFATVFAMIVVVLGAFTRLTDAGLGCPDWPGCYGFMHIPTKSDHIELANQAFPEQPYEFHKAWPEMVHRYFAGTLGILVLILAIASWRNQQKFSIKHSTFLLVLITFQAALGMWTVTMKLHPVIVLLHLMGGIMTFSLLAALLLRYHYQFNPPIFQSGKSLQKIVIFGLIIVVIQVALGGWTSANYAAMVCHELPICQGHWLANADFYHGFNFFGKQADSYEYGILDQNARIAIHVTHRIGAIITTLVLLYLIFYLFKQTHQVLKRFAWTLSILLVTQIILGINNIIFQLPLFNAVAHNAVGALLVVAMVCLLTFLLIASNTKEKVRFND